MAGRTLDIKDLLSPDDLGIKIADQWVQWKNLRAPREAEWAEVRQYVYATDTSKTSNAKLPWKNKTTIPKLCQIRDNLYANYIAAMFPKRRWLTWEGDTSDDQQKEKADAIETYMNWVVERSGFKHVISQALLDYIDYGDCHVTPDWQDDRQTTKSGDTKIGYVGPVARRINPLDLCLNPIAPNVAVAPKIVRSFLSIGEVKEIIDRETTDANLAEYEALFKYLLDIRQSAANVGADVQIIDGFFQVDGFTSFRSYLMSDYVEILTFYGDIYDAEKGEFKRNQIAMVADRHKLISIKDNPSFFGTAPIYSSSWRKRQDNLYGMGPLDNLVGMQYRIDHLENLKADCFDIIAFPPLKVKGYVEDFRWGPMERIYVGDDGDVNMLVPDVQVLQADNQIALLENKMEEMAGAPRSAMGIRTPGEKTAFEVQALDMGSSRMFQNKIAYFEKWFLEPLLNNMLEMARRNLDQPAIVALAADDLGILEFLTVTREDITAKGRLVPMGARHFAVQNQLVQNLTQLSNTGIYQDPMVQAHMSSKAIAKLVIDALSLSKYNIYAENVRVTEQLETQQLAQQAQEELQMAGMTPVDMPRDQLAEEVNAPTEEDTPPTSDEL